jgi:hypothetical protein
MYLGPHIFEFDRRYGAGAPERHNRTYQGNAKRHSGKLLPLEVCIVPKQ